MKNRTLYDAVMTNQLFWKHSACTYYFFKCSHYVYESMKLSLGSYKLNAHIHSTTRVKDQTKRRNGNVKFSRVFFYFFIWAISICSTRIKLLADSVIQWNECAKFAKRHNAYELSKSMAFLLQRIIVPKTDANSAGWAKKIKFSALLLFAFQFRRIKWDNNFYRIRVG